MSNLILNNAYRILGLDNSSSTRDILKRYKEVSGRLKIDDYPKYDFDLNLPSNLRTEESVDDALKKLQNPKSKMMEYFFWFDISDTVDEDAFEHLQYGDTASYDDAAQIWEKYSNTDNSTGLTYKKNLAILFCLCMFDEENDSFLSKSVLIWNELLNSDRFWTSFGKKYEVSNGSGISDDVMNNVRGNVVSNISEIYYDLYVHHDDTKYVQEFHNAFGIFGKKTEKYLFDPIRQSIYEIIEELNELDQKNANPSENENVKCDNCGNVSRRLSRSHFSYRDGSILCMKCNRNSGKEWQKRVNSVETVEGSSKLLRQIQKSMERLELNLEQLQKIGLYECDQSKVMRDHIAEAIRMASVKIHNKAHMREESLELLNMAKKISCTADTKEKMESDSQTITEYITRDEENALVIEIGRFRKKRLVIRETFMEYKDTKIYYDDVNSIQYYSSDGNHIFKITSLRNKMSLKVNESSGSALFNSVQSLVVPRLVENLVKIIFENEDDVNVGSVRFDKTGYHHMRRIRGEESVLWKNVPYIPQIVSGKAVLYMTKKDAVKQLASISIQVPNAIIIPELVNACFNESKMRSQG